MAARTRLRLLAVIPSLAGGGSERVLTTLLRHIDRDRFDPVLAVVDGRSAELSADVPPDLPLLDLQALRVRRAAPALLRQIRQVRPDVVLSTLGHLNLMLALLRPLLPRGVKVVARESSIVSQLLQREPHPWAWRAGYRLLYPRLDMVICQSESMRHDLCSGFSMPASRTVVIPNPLDLDRIARLAGERGAHDEAAPDPGITRLLAVGRLSAEKGFDVLLRAVARCDVSRLRLDILGQGAQEDALRKLASQLGLQDHVRFHGYQANPYGWMRRADALVLSSRYEGLPNAVLEALACGTPVISTPVPSALEILGRVPQAVIAEAFDEDALASAISSWLSGSRERVAESAAELYGVRAVTRRYEEALQHVAGL